MICGILHSKKAHVRCDNKGRGRLFTHYYYYYYCHYCVWSWMGVSQQACATLLCTFQTMTAHTNAVSPDTCTVSAPHVIIWMNSPMNSLLDHISLMLLW